AVEDLRERDVTFEEGALSSSQLDELDATASRLQDRDGYFKVVVLAEPIEDFSSGRAFADDVREGLAGRGRVIVYTPNEVAVSSNSDTAQEVDAAEQAAADRLNSGGSLASATTAAANELGAAGSGMAADKGGGGFPWLFLLLIIGIPLLLLWLVMRSARKQRQQAQRLSAEQIGTAETKVRSAVDKVANDLLELADHTDNPDTPAEVRASFSQGAQLFTETQKLLEEADTQPELETAYGQVVKASWHMDVTRALLAGEPAPLEPEPEELFPAPVVPAGAPAGGPVPGDVGAPEPRYGKPDMSPWITAAAIAAMSMLSRRGVAQPQTRAPMDDGMFGSWLGGLTGSSGSPRSSRSSGGGILGGMFGRGGGGRSGGGSVVVPSGRGRRRGMGRR
ncbi:MAG: hypothetical protein ACRDZN_00630, partial [Acidimicrobiales bacterium]